MKFRMQMWRVNIKGSMPTRRARLSQDLQADLYTGTRGKHMVVLCSRALCTDGQLALSSIVPIRYKGPLRT